MKSLDKWISSYIGKLKKKSITDSIKHIDEDAKQFYIAKGKEKALKDCKEFMAVHLKSKFADFAKFIYDEFTDTYGHIQISQESDGEFGIHSFESAAEEFLTQKGK